MFPKANKQEMSDIVFFMLAPPEAELERRRKINAAAKRSVKPEAKALTEEERRDARALFKLYDTNNDGTISKAELFDALASGGSFVSRDGGMNEGELSKIFAQLDEDGSDSLSFDEFCTLFAA